MEESIDTSVPSRGRVGSALRRGANWTQLLKFCAVGASGYAVNLAVFTLLVQGFDVHYIPSAIVSFVVAVANNYTWNRLWTFRGSRGHVAYQGLRFLVVSVASLAANLVLLELIVSATDRPVLAQAIAIVLVTPLNFLGNKLWSFRR